MTLKPCKLKESHPACLQQSAAKIWANIRCLFFGCQDDQHRPLLLLHLQGTWVMVVSCCMVALHGFFIACLYPACLHFSTAHSCILYYRKPRTLTTFPAPYLEKQINKWKTIPQKHKGWQNWADVERLTTFRPYVSGQMHAYNNHTALVIVKTSHIGTCAVRANFFLSPFEGALKNASVISAN